MDSPQTLIDLQFGVSQLSGNEPLYLTLLQKLAGEYRNSGAQLTPFLARRDWEEAHILVHSLKGVAGNLGCSDLHSACRPLETEISAREVDPATLDAFLLSLQATLKAIDALTTGPAFQQDNATIARRAMLQALRNNDYITAAQLDEWLVIVTPDAVLQKALREAVYELDYHTAIHLLSV